MFSRLRAAFWPLAAALLCAPMVAHGQAKPVASPSNYIPQTAISYGSPGQPATPVTPATPLPTICVSGCSATGAGTATAEPPTLSEGQSAALSFDLGGGLRISGGGGGGSGGPTTLADGADATQGARGDAAWLGTGPGSITAILKAIRLGQSAAQPVTGTFWQATQPVSGTFWQATQPVSAVALPLPSGASTLAGQTTGNNSLSSIDSKLTGAASAANQAALQAVVGAAADPTCTSDAGTCSLIALQKRNNERLSAMLVATDPVPVTQSGTWTFQATTPSCTGGLYRSAAGTNSTLIASGPRVLCSLWVVNTSATVVYLRVYDQAAAPTCSSGTGERLSVPIPAGTSGAGVAPSLGAGITFAAGLGFCITGGDASNDNTAAVAGVTVNYGYR